MMQKTLDIEVYDDAICAECPQYAADIETTTLYGLHRIIHNVEHAYCKNVQMCRGIFGNALSNPPARKRLIELLADK